MHIHLSTYTTNGNDSFSPPNHTTSTSDMKELLFLKTAEPSRVAFWYRATAIKLQLIKIVSDMYVHVNYILTSCLFTVIFDL